MKRGFIMSKKTSIKLAYIGGGSRMWARGLMSDLALDEHLSGEVRLYDIDYQAALDNAKIGTLMQQDKEAKSEFKYVAVKTLAEALKDVDFVVISILPATFNEMEVYTHLPEKYGIYQTVGDTVGPAGVMRGLIAYPMFVEFAQAIKTYAPHAWVINFTNPMTICLQALYDGFPEIKAYGNCHEVFGSQKDLRDIYNAAHPEHQASREDIKITVSGINHFTWITEASAHGEDVLKLYHQHVEENYDPNYEKEPGRYKKNFPFGSEGKVKLDMYRRYHAMAAAGDRHLVEFMPRAHYLESEERIDYFKFNRTPVSWRKQTLERAIAQTKRMVQGEEEVKLWRSGEEGIRQIKALLGYETLITNVNFINHGQADGLPKGHIVETNALFRYQLLQPIFAGKLPKAVEGMVNRHIDNHKLVMKSYKEKDLSYALHALSNDPLCTHLNIETLKVMFDEMCEGVKPYLDYYQSKHL